MRDFFEFYCIAYQAFISFDGFNLSMLGCGCSPSYFLHQMVKFSASLTLTSGGMSGQKEADLGQTGGFLYPIEL